MADRQFDPLGTVAVPADWTLPANLQLLLKNVYASFDGTAAAAAYLPCLEILSDSGHMVGAYPSLTQVAAGASADVTWFPGLTRSAAASSALSPDWGTYFTNSVSVLSGSQQAAQLFANAGSALLDVSNPAAATFVSRGVYEVTAWIQSGDKWDTPAGGGGRIVFGTPTTYEQRQTGGIGAAGELHNFAVTLVAEANAGASIGLTFENFDTSTHNMYSNQVLVQLIGTY